MAVANPIELSGYIIAMAVSARVAQGVMSTGMDPMTIKEFKFTANISADFGIQSQTDVALNIWRMSIKEKLTIDYKSHWGLEISAVIVPSVTLV